MKKFYLVSVSLNDKLNPNPVIVGVIENDEIGARSVVIDFYNQNNEEGKVNVGLPIQFPIPIIISVEDL